MRADESVFFAKNVTRQSKKELLMSRIQCGEGKPYHFVRFVRHK